MAKITKAMNDKALRETVFDLLFKTDEENSLLNYFHKINDRQYGIILTDLNGEERYIRLGAIVAEAREDMTASELMALEIEEYKMKQDKKEQDAQKRAEKARKDKERREKEKEGNK